jgi:hypothetical protein
LQKTVFFSPAVAAIISGLEKSCTPDAAKRKLLAKLV